MTKHKRKVLINTANLNQAKLDELEALIDEKLEEMHKMNFKLQAIDDYERAMTIMISVNAVVGLLTEEEFIIATPVIDRYFQQVRKLVPPSVAKSNPDFFKLMNMVHQAANAVTQAEHEVIRAQRLELKRRLRPVQGLSTEAPLCTRCGKRQQHFGTLCKRCADETGERPKGKV